MSRAWPVPRDELVRVASHDPSWDGRSAQEAPAIRNLGWDAYGEGQRDSVDRLERDALSEVVGTRRPTTSAGPPIIPVEDPPEASLLTSDIPAEPTPPSPRGAGLGSRPKSEACLESSRAPRDTGPTRERPGTTVRAAHAGRRP